MSAREHVLQTVFAADPFVIQTARVAHPAGIDGVVLARLVAINFFLARADDDVAARRAARADAFGFLQKPDAHLETKILRRERADGTDVHGVERVIVVENFSRIRRERVPTAAIDDAERVIADDVLRETDAARAKDATLVVEHDARTEVDGLGLVNFWFDEAARALAVIHGIFLQLALAGLIADRTVERMIDEQKFQNAFAHLFHAGRRSVNFHAGRNRRRACDGRTRRLRDLRRAVGIQNRLAIRAERGRPIFHEAHAAVADDRQLRMIAIMRHVGRGERARLDHRGRNRLAGNRVGHRLGHFDFATVHLHLDFFNRRRGLDFSCGCG